MIKSYKNAYPSPTTTHLISCKGMFVRLNVNLNVILNNFDNKYTVYIYLVVNISNFSRDTFSKYSNRKFKSTNGKGETPLDTGTKNAKSEKILINCTFIYDMYVVLMIFSSDALRPSQHFLLMSGRFPSWVSFELATYHAVDTRLYYAKF